MSSKIAATAEVNDPRTAASNHSSRSFVRFLPAVARIVLGLSLLAFGLNAFLNFIPPPPTPLPERAMEFVGALANSGYMLPLIGITHLFVGTLLVINRWVPLALVVLAPFLVNSVAFHLFLERSGLPMALIFSAVELYLAWVYRDAFRPLFSRRA